MLNALSAVAFALAVQAAPAEPQKPTLDDRFTALNSEAWSAIEAHRPQAAVDALTPALTAYEAELNSEKRRIYCAMSQTELVIYASLGAKDGKGAVVIAPGYCEALFLRGFAAVDLGQHAEAKAIYRKLLGLAPMNSHYHTEYGQLLGREKKWGEMLKQCNSAEGYAGFSVEQRQGQLRGAAIRCQGFALIEQGKLDEAEKRFRQALAIDANDAKAQQELRYIAEQRGAGARS